MLAGACVHRLDGARASIKQAGPRRAHGRGRWLRCCTSSRTSWPLGPDGGDVSHRELLMPLSSSRFKIHASQRSGGMSVAIACAPSPRWLVSPALGGLLLFFLLVVRRPVSSAADAVLDTEGGWWGGGGRGSQSCCRFSFHLPCPKAYHYYLLPPSQCSASATPPSASSELYGEETSTPPRFPDEVAERRNIIGDIHKPRTRSTTSIRWSPVPPTRSWTGGGLGDATASPSTCHVPKLTTLTSCY